MNEPPRNFQERVEYGLNQVFDNIRNLVLCALLFAAGTQTLKTHEELFFGLFVSTVAGWGLIVVAALLTLANICVGLFKLSKLRHHVMLQAGLCLIYVVFAVRVVEILWHYRN
ncbi:hypothetical protein D9M68_177610 [compost metagenome]|uniref:Uncharacterized protein n=1 Tax=Pseudomonas jinjuensis TaxID=198616 RepID=A0A1H0LN72_9PSED|nr:DUF6332 family protein [Pseudomonas jinjuensis]SDO69503.1 hypothetical protein SAMN05216193_114125 [Pseudomonas jinjuensis]